MERENVPGKREKERASNKNTNRNKEGFAFDKHRKKAQRKVVTYTSANYDDGLRRRPVPQPEIPRLP